MSGEHEHCPFCGDDMCDGRCYDALLDRLANAGIDLIAKDRRIDDLEAIVSRLPHTADGVPVVPGMRVWFTRDIDKPWDSSFTIDGIDDDGLYMQIEGDYHWHKERIESPIYSTKAAAEKASQS